MAVYVDPSGDGQRAWVFGVNPLGVAVDGVRTASSDGDDLSWDGRWSAAARIVEDGWVAEIAIPWRTMRHPADLSRIGLLVMRTLPRTGESSAWPAVSAERPGWVDQAAMNRRYALRYAEKTPFFLEGQEWFEAAACA